MTLILRTAAHLLRANGHQVFAPPSAPAPGSVWTPTRTAALARVVLPSAPGTVAYQRVDARTGAMWDAVRVCSVAGWHRWRRRVGAKP